MSEHDRLLCPSHRCAVGAQLVGIVGADSKVMFLGTPVRIDRAFVAIAREGRPPENRFRFANKCAESLCANWDRHQCGLAAKMRDAVEPATGELPACGIRDACRWYAEQGTAACGICPLVIRGAEEETVVR